jgi:hypothetical protein
VDGFVDTPGDPVPQVKTTLTARDRLQTIVLRIGYGRSDYKVIPGLYCVGNPTPDSPVIVTANYKLTFDMVRKELGGMDAWLLVADTRGINVWCAAGKALFSTEEIIHSVRSANLDKIVNHDELILPQLGAPGVAAHKVHAGCGFKVIYGPVWAEDLPAFIRAGCQADEAMRSVTFTLKQRVELIPVEFFLQGTLLAIITVAAFLLSGIGPDIFSLPAAWTRGLAAVSATLFGIIGGIVIVPLLLPKLPWRHFSPKGALTGSIMGVLNLLLFASVLGPGEMLALFLWTTTVASYLAMNFTGSTPFTSPTGVETEMRRAIPVQGTAALAAIIIWLAAPFLG